MDIGGMRITSTGNQQRRRKVVESNKSGVELTTRQHM